MKNRNEDTISLQLSYRVFTILKSFFELILIYLNKKKAPFKWGLFNVFKRFIS